MKTAVALTAAIAFASVAPSALAAENPENLIKKNGCIACHTVEKQVVGPAYRDVARKYAGQKGIEKTLFDRVKKGSVGVWGKTPMPPNAHVPDAEIQAMVAWILTRK